MKAVWVRSEANHKTPKHWWKHHRHSSRTATCSPISHDHDSLWKSAHCLWKSHSDTLDLWVERFVFDFRLLPNNIKLLKMKYMKYTESGINGEGVSQGWTGDQFYQIKKELLFFSLGSSGVLFFHLLIYCICLYHFHRILLTTNMFPVIWVKWPVKFTDIFLTASQISAHPHLSTSNLYQMLDSDVPSMLSFSLIISLSHTHNADKVGSGPLITPPVYMLFFVQTSLVLFLPDIFLSMSVCLCPFLPSLWSMSYGSIF